MATGSGLKLKTKGLALKVPAQAITTVVVWLLAYFGVDLPPDVSLAIAAIIGFVAGIVAPAAPTTTAAPARRRRVRKKTEAA